MTNPGDVTEGARGRYVLVTSLAPSPCGNVTLSTLVPDGTWFPPRDPEPSWFVDRLTAVRVSQGEGA